MTDYWDDGKVLCVKCKHEGFVLDNEFNFVCAKCGGTEVVTKKDMKNIEKE